VGAHDDIPSLRVDDAEVILTSSDKFHQHVLQRVREEYYYTRFALMYFDLPREKAGEAGWAARRSFSSPFLGVLRGLKRGVLRLPSTKDTARKLPVVIKSSWRVEMARQDRRRGDVSL